MKGIFKNSAFVLMLAALLAVWSCTPMKKMGTTLFGPTPEQEAFMAIGHAIEEGAYAKALSLCDSYLAEFPESPNLPDVMLKRAMLFSIKNEFERALAQYNELLERFPGTPEAEEAQIGIMAAWYKQKRYGRVIELEKRIDDSSVSQDTIVRKYSLLADAYLGLGRPMDAAYVLATALKKVGRQGRKKLLIAFDRVAAAIEPEGLSMLLSSVKDPDYRGYLTCRIAEKHMAKEDYGKAESVLSNFIKAFPENRYIGKAESLLEQIGKESAYQRYTVACLLPLTGRYMVFGQRALYGIQMAFESFVSKKGGKREQLPVKLVVRDTGSDPGTAERAVQELANQRVAAIIGPLLPLDKAIAQAQTSHIPIVTLTQGEDVPGIGDYVFRNFLTPQMQTHALVSYATGTLGLQRFAVLYPDETYGKVFAHCFWDEVLKAGGSIVGFEPYDPNETDFADSIKKLVGLYYEVPEDLKEKVAKMYEPWLIKQEMQNVSDEAALQDEQAVEADTDVNEAEGDEIEGENANQQEEKEKPIVDFEAVFIPDGPTKAGLILPQLAYYDIKDVLLMGTNLWHSDNLVKMAKKYANGAVMPTAFWERSDFVKTREFSRRFEELFGEKPGFIAAIAYDTANILFSIVSDPSVRYRSDIRDRLAGLSGFQGITGATSFDKNGEVHKDLTLLKIDGRRFVEIVSGQHQQTP